MRLAVQYRDAFSQLAAIDGAEAPGEDEILPSGPRVLAREQLWELASLTEQLWAELDRNVRRALGAGLAQELGFASAALIAATPSLLPAPVRADFVPTREGYRLVEWNVDPCLGGLASRQLFDCFVRAGRAEGMVFHDPAVALGRSLGKLRSDGRPLWVAIRRGDLPRWGANAERLAEVARDAGLEARVAPLDQLTGRNHIDVLRLFHLEHAGDPQIRELCGNPTVRLVYGFDTELWGDKQWLSRVKWPENLRRFVPATYPIAAVLPSLRAERERWILKPHAGAAGQGVVAGREQNATEWKATVERALAEPGSIAQLLVEPLLHEGNVETLGIFLVEGRFAGAYCRSQPASGGVVIDAHSSFNVVVTPRATVPPLAVRRLWSGVELNTFDGLAVAHLTGGGARTQASPAEAGAGFARGPLPETGAPLDQIVATLQQDLLPFCHDKRRPEYLAHLDVPPADLSIAAGTLIRALAQDPVTWTSSRAGTFVEEQVLGWLTDLAFSPARSGAVACSGGTQANLLAVLLARNLAFENDLVARRGLGAALAVSGIRSLKVLASDAIHGSVGAAVRNAGLGDEGLVRLPVDAHDRLRLDALAEALHDAERLGDRVALVVLNAGTVGVGAIDPLQPAAALAHRHGARVHVDAAHGAMLLWSRRYRARLAGIEAADSITADPHKVLGLNQGLGALLLRERNDRRAVTKDGAAYFTSPDGAPDSSRFTLEGTRPLHALAAWILVRHLGHSGYQQVVDHLLALTERFTDQVSQDFELYAPPAMNLVGFRPAEESQLLQIEDRLRRTRYRLSRYQSARGAFLRAVFVNPATTTETVDELTRILR